MTYRIKRLDDYIDILSGFAFKSKDFTGKGVPVIKIKNISPPSVTLDDLSYVSNEIADKHKKFILSFDDVLIAMTGSHINQWASVVGRVERVKYTDKTLLNQRVGKITIKENAEADINYVYYFLSQDKVKIELAAKAGGAANQANISPAHIKQLKFPCPDIDVQIKIAGILRAYDDLIENNQKQIKLLEEAARRLYKEWFVDLRFPGYENVAVVDGVPEGWKVRRISDVCDTVGGGTPSTKVKEYYQNGDILWGTPTDITENNSLILLDTGTKITKEGLENSSAKMVPVETILMTSRASVGFFGICEHKVCTNQGFISCVPYRDNMQMFILYNLMNRVDEIRGNAGGSTYLEISKKVFREFKIVVPDDKTLNRFQSIVYIIYSTNENFGKVNSTITAGS